MDLHWYKNQLDNAATSLTNAPRWLSTIVGFAVLFILGALWAIVPEMKVKVLFWWLVGLAGLLCLVDAVISRVYLRRTNLKFMAEMAEMAQQWLVMADVAEQHGVGTAEWCEAAKTATLESLGDGHDQLLPRHPDPIYGGLIRHRAEGLLACRTPKEVKALFAQWRQQQDE